jgi:hypothetical protein
MSQGYQAKDGASGSYPQANRSPMVPIIPPIVPRAFHDGS